MGSSSSLVDWSHPADRHVTCLHTRSGIESLVTAAVQLSSGMDEHRHA